MRISEKTLIANLERIAMIEGGVKEVTLAGMTYRKIEDTDGFFWVQTGGTPSPMGLYETISLSHTRYDDDLPDPIVVHVQADQPEGDEEAEPVEVVADEETETDTGGKADHKGRAGKQRT